MAGCNMARKTIKLPTLQEIEGLYKRENVEELRKINERLAKTANQRMAQLYESNIKSSPALANAKYYLYQVSEIHTGGVFSRSKKLDPEQLLEQITEELKFLKDESSTVSGEKERRAIKAFETLTDEDKTDEEGNPIEPYMKIPKEIKVPEEWTGTPQEYFRTKWLEFLKSNAWKDVKKYKYSDENPTLLRQAGEAIARGAELKDLKKAYTKYLQNEIDIFSMWDNWISVK